jgi:endonuclease-3 related protein
VSSAAILSEIFRLLFDRFGPQQWWPADSAYEVMVGAVLTQNTNWQNVERAILNLKQADILSFEKMVELPAGLLAEYIRPAGYYNIKAGRLQNLLNMVNDQYEGNLELLFDEETGELRQQLLSVKGIGPETADSIALYAAHKPVFVVDAYTHRILSRHNIIDEQSGYYDIQELFMDNLASDCTLFNEYHALLVKTAKEYCKKKNPLCEKCPLRDFAV